MGFENLPDIITVAELAEFLKTSPQTIRRAVKKGELKVLKVGGEFRFTKEDVINWVKQ